MKLVLLIVTTLVSLHCLSKNKEDLSQMLKDSNCIPVRDNGGNVSSYQCNDSSSGKMQQGQYQKLQTQKIKTMNVKTGDIITSANGKKIDNPARAMELYSSLKSTNTLTVERPITLAHKVKSCLDGIYAKQISFHKAMGTYTSSNEEFGLSRISTCNGLNISANYATQSEFKIIAKAGEKGWSIDESKTMEELP